MSDAPYSKEPVRKRISPLTALRFLIRLPLKPLIRLGSWLRRIGAKPLLLAPVAVLLFGISSWFAYRQDCRPYQWHRAYTPLSYRWWSNTLDWNVDAGLPKIVGNIKTAALSADGKRLWIAGDAGLLAYTDDQGRSWTLLDYDPGKDEFHVPSAISGLAQTALESLWEWPMLGGTVHADSSNQAVPQSQGQQSKSVMQDSKPKGIGQLPISPTPSPMPSHQAPDIVALDIPSTAFNLSTSDDNRYFTNDGGLTWGPSGVEYLSPTGKYPYGLVVGQRSFLVVRDNTTGRRQLILDGGFVSDNRLSFESFPLRNGATASPTAVTIQRFDSATRKWIPLPAWDGSPVTAMWLAKQRLWVISKDAAFKSKVFFSDDDGKTFQQNSIWQSFSLESLVFDAQGRQGWLLGDNGVVLRTDDNGKSWDPITRSAGDKEDQGETYSRMLAPWYWLALLLCAVLISPSFAPQETLEETTAMITIPVVEDDRQPEAATVKFEIGNQVISDRPLEPGEPDALGLGAIAAGLAFFLRNDKTKPPLAIGVSGRWGSGKSSLMNLLKKNLENYGSRPVWFNAWHHQKEEQLLAALLQAIKTQAVPTLPAGLGFRLRLAWVRLQRHWFRIALAAAFVFLVYRLEVFLHQQAAVASFLNSLLAGKLAEGLRDLLPQNLLTIVTGSAALLKVLSAGLTAFGTDPASLLSSISKGTRVKDLAAQTSFRERFAQEFADVTQALGKKRMVILVDDLDRCRPEKVREVLEAVNFLVSSGDCFIVLGMARDMVEHCVGLSFREVVDTLGWESMGLSLPEIERVISETERTVAKGSNPPPSVADGRRGTETLAKRRAFARLYLDKLIQIEVAIPEPTSGQKRLLFQTEGEASGQESKGELRVGALIRGSRKFWQTASPIVGAALMAVILVGIGLFAGHYARSLGSWLVATQASSGNAQVGPQASAETSGAQTTSTSSPSPTPGRSVVSRSSGDQTVKPEIEAGLILQRDWFSFWPFYLVLLGAAGAASSLLGQFPAREVTDTEPFVNALKVWHPLVMSNGARNTPRTAKRFQNRVRYLAMRQRAQMMGAPRSLGERCLRTVLRVPVQQPDPPVWLPNSENLSFVLEKEIGGLRNLLDNRENGDTRYWRVKQDVPGPLVSTLDGAPFPAHTALALAEGNVYVPEPLLVALAAIDEYDPLCIEDEDRFRKLIVSPSAMASDGIGLDFLAVFSEHRSIWDNWYNMIYYRNAYLRLNSDANCHKSPEEKHFSATSAK